MENLPALGETARIIEQLLESENDPAPQPPTRCSPPTVSRSPATGSTRSSAATPPDLDDPRTGRRIGPHTFRHTAAVHLLEAGVEVNVIRGWLGHVDLATTNRYAEINTNTKQQRYAPPNLQTFGGIPHQRQSGGPTRRS